MKAKVIEIDFPSGIVSVQISGDIPKSLKLGDEFQMSEVTPPPPPIETPPPPKNP